MKPPMNLNHIQIVDRTSEMVIHPKRRYSYCIKLIGEMEDDGENAVPSKRHTQSFDCGRREQGLLNPEQIPRIVRRSLLDLHKATVEMAQPFTKYSSSLSIGENQRQQKPLIMGTSSRYVQESPV
ncbi:unnamed protein product [Didymodactylos carnosus]|uniref:Uncharacterized protein n=1 Tax=Didymodactylos carnosus TaxID=1234261 RepID=A0A813NTS5_9BILA|nr:unnamed protein product [Didymodactylos carnosus]CAF1222832.1 unnamed protein product [Didymodactylos carnosus]CAF3523501.1 unnamed protein product [Didymodactylos carnosus]CAF4031020.1 unnamed protein product [Didymodactylos carnosus]